ncbi:MAG: hypothetical protein ACUVTW_06270 [Thermogutta sp.]
MSKERGVSEVWHFGEMKETAGRRRKFPDHAVGVLSDSIATV